MIILDSNIFIALFFPEDPLHEKATGFLELLENRKFMYTSEVLEEVVTIIAIRKNSELAITVKNTLQENFTIFPEKISKEGIWSDFESLSPHRFSYTDVSLYSLSKKFGVEVLTFDDKLKKRIQMI